ncbi:hypothetical protein GGI25_001608 [Coemansia spiralis]|uniref:Uncharacterized protein n=2 Tax=Coemansia TaxID=4863 RepID=A0A9W8GCA5_9FUNG|nr:hypothetical protein BX070DRAFT_237527 [Coemansia spiralis]KAJ1991601.1 hypothetical protein EDC05_003366 [Coemansia umbellata]KAJ2623961.1 hypothetical protein GGI26_001976 [Coemansia sp. RSA 1358]KAJ2679252.1 hypothetical protein GGI25_001608 [Coemansia spiralis]
MIFRTTLCAAAALLAAAATFPKGAVGNESGCVSSFDPSTDYFPDKAQVKYGAGFDISYNGNAKYITNKVSGENYVLYQCGTPIPNGVQPTPANSLQVGNWTKVAAVPGTKIVLSSAPASAIIEALGLQDAVAASYKFLSVTSPCMQKLLDSLPRIEQTYATPSNRRRGIGSASRKNTLVRRVSYDLGNQGLQWTFTTYGMSDPRSFAVNPEDATDMLGKAEWIKFVAAFFNKEAEANKLFADIESRYNSLKKSDSVKKTVGIARYNKAANGTILGWTTVPAQPWLAQGLSDAGYNTHTKDMISYTNIDDFNKAVSGWDVLIDTSMEPLPHGGAKVPEWQDLTNGYKLGSTGAKSLSFLAQNAIYRSDLISSTQNATDADEHLQVQPDVLLDDLIKVASAASGAKDAHWYRNLPLQMSIDWTSPAECTN